MNPFWPRKRPLTSLPEHEALPSCRDVARVVQAYLDGECDAMTKEQVIAHLEACPPCSVETEVLEHIKQSMAEGRCCGADPDIVDRLKEYARHLGDEAS